MPSLEKSPVVDVGSQFGPYELVRRLGVGGTAETFEAIRRGAGGFTQRVCLKVVLAFYRDDDAFKRLFQREAMLAAKLRHRNIVGVIDFGEVGGRSYLALELVDGIDLRTLLDTHEQQRLDPDLVVLLGLELAAALVHAHSPPSGAGFDGLVHRDISPSNVLISRHGEVLLTDFGVAKANEEQRRKSSAAKGKFPYMSPEQLRAEPVDGRSDLFALGVVLFEALSGIRPFEGPNDPTTIMRILNGDHADLAEWVPEAPPKLCEVIEQLIRTDPDERLQTAAQLIEALDELAPSPRVQARLGALAEERMDLERTSASEVSSTVGKPLPGPGMGAGAEDDRGNGEPIAQSPAAAGTADEHRSRRRIALALLGFLLAAGMAAAVFWRIERNDSVEPGAAPSETERGTRADTDADTGAEAGVETGAATGTDTGAETGTGTGAESGASPAPAPRKVLPPKPARLDVIVVPWGDVWINGQRWGPAPMMNETLKPGRYRISAGQGGPSKTQTVRLRSGERKTINFDLTQ